MNIQPEPLNLHHSFSIASKQELISVFRSHDQKKLILPEAVKFPLTVQSYFTWSEPSGVYVYLVFKLPNWDLPKGVAFKKVPFSGEPVGCLCNWCHAYGSSQEIGLMSVMINKKTSASYPICKDLSCAKKIEDMSNLSGKNPHRHQVELYAKMKIFFESLSEPQE